MFAAFAQELEALGRQPWVLRYPTNRAMGYAELAARVLGQLPEDPPFVLLAESFSGPVALRVASAKPGRCAGLVLSTTFARSPLPWARALAPALTWAPTKPPLALLSWLLLGRWSTAALRAELSASLAEVEPQVLRVRAAEALRVDVRERCAAIDLPSLILVATSDRLQGAEPSRALSKLLPQARVAEIDGPHLLLQARPRECAHLIAEFVAQLDGKRVHSQLVGP
jgi:pimeloyl-[acyl-carrier protein] methyl ester esterase